MTYFPRQPIDRGVKHIAPQDPTDLRILTAEELSLQEEIAAVSLQQQGKLAFIDQPSITVVGRDINIVGSLYSEVYSNKLLSLDTTFTAADTVVSGEKKTEYFYLTTLLAIVNSDTDSDLGTFSRQFSGETITEERENTQRIRCFWLLLASYTPIDLNTFKTLISVTPDYDHHGETGSITIETTNPSDGFLVGDIRFYPLDPNWTDGTYSIILDSVELAKLCSINHYLNFVETGYLYPDTASTMPPESLSLLFLQAKKETIVDRFIYGLMKGEPLPTRNKSRAVLNTILGSTNPNSTPHPGMTNPSPNGSNIIGNDQRIFFASEARLQRNSVQFLTAEIGENGKPMITATLNTNNPTGTIFSNDATDHRIWSLGGILQNDFGTFSDLGSDRSLTWTGNDNTTVQLNDTLVVAPGVIFPGGSGMNLAMEELVGVYKDGIPISSENIRFGRTQDIDSYTEPANGENYLVVWNSERAAIQYIYKKLQLQPDANGVAIIPQTEFGGIAFIDGVPGRFDSPVVEGLNPLSTYDALIYYPPRSNGEIWQFEIIFTPYQGMGTEGLDLLNGGEIISEAKYFVHSQGGGLSVHQGDASLNKSAISMHLPSQSGQHPHYLLDSPVRLRAESYPGPQTFRELFLPPGEQLAKPQLGMVLQYDDYGGHQPRSLSIALKDNLGNLLGAKSPYFYNAIDYYQIVCAFLVKKGDLQGMCVITHNQVGNQNLPFDVNSGAAIDVFPVDGGVI